MTGHENLLPARELVSELPSIELAPEEVALVGHGGLYLAALPMLFAPVSIDDARRFGLGHCEIVTATWDGSHWTCQQWGNHDIA